MGQTLDETAENMATLTEGMGTLVAARRTLVEGGFSSEEAAMIVLEALRAATKANA